MTSSEPIYSTDLAGIVVGDTAISDVQGECGRLSYRGYDIADLVNVPFLEVVWIVLFGSRPDAEEHEVLNDFMLEHSQLCSTEITLLNAVARDLHPMLMLQGLIPLLQAPETGALPIAHDAERGLFLAAKMSALIAAHYRLSQGEKIASSDKSSSFHEHFLTQFHGHSPSPEAVRMLDAAQVLQMEHSFNCGTFAGRVCASTLAPIQSCLSASVGTLFGKLHGGADQAALEMALHIGSPDEAEAYVRDCLQRKEKIMGMGHREYRTVDPRASILKPMAVELCQDAESRRLLMTLMAVEDACQRAFFEQGKEIWANVEFYKGAVFHSLGVPSHFFTALFAMARVYGYIAHFLEFSKNSRLILPRANYIGPATADLRRSVA
ncbi:MAG: citrate/2-methylcitrate synthase [Pseudomonadota bacterium]